MSVVARRFTSNNDGVTDTWDEARNTREAVMTTVVPLTEASYYALGNPRRTTHPLNDRKTTYPDLP
jgi:hypothetical protein